MSCVFAQLHNARSRASVLLATMGARSAISSTSWRTSRADFAKAPTSQLGDNLGAQQALGLPLRGGARLGADVLGDKAFGDGGDAIFASAPSKPSRRPRRRPYGRFSGRMGRRLARSRLALPGQPAGFREANGNGADGQVARLTPAYL